VLITNSENDLRYIQQNNEFDYLTKLIECIDNGCVLGILLYGPPGTGKTLLATSLAKSFNSKYFVIDGSPDLDRRDLEGYWELFKGGTRFTNGPLTQAIKKANEEGICFIIINEINAIRDSEQISLNSLLSENQINLISKGFEKHRLNLGSKLIIIGTMNKGVVGINKLQEAFEDRFIVCPEIDYAPKEKEIEIAKQMSKCNKKIAELVVDTARQIRKQATEDFSLSKIFSTRLIVNFCRLITKMPVKYLKDTIENVIINKLGETQEEKKSIALILDGKMLENRLKSILNGKETESTQKFLTNKDLKEIPVVQTLKNAIEFYKSRYGGITQKNNSKIMWKFIEWLWRNYKSEVTEYFKLIEDLKWHELYKKKTGKCHIYRSRITLKYLRWLFRGEKTYFEDLMKKYFPIL